MSTFSSKRIVFALFSSFLFAVFLLSMVSALDPYKVDWHIQIDAANKTACTISYDLGKYSFNINQDKTLNKGAGPCLSLTSDRFWLKVKTSTDCIRKTYNITCNEDFTVSLFYIEKSIYNILSQNYPSPYNETVGLSILDLVSAEPPTNECQTVYNYSCRELAECPETEEQMSYSCTSGICCKTKEITEDCQTSEDCSKSSCKGAWITVEGNYFKCEYPKEMTCDDEFDNDGDNYIDSLDDDCKVTEEENCIEKGGEECDRTEECSIAVERAKDTYQCCLGECIPATQTCAEQNGIECLENQQCKNDNWTSASDSYLCCRSECQSKTSIIPFIIIAIILALGAGAFFLYKKGFFRKKLAVSKPIFPPPAFPGYRPPVRPLAQQPQTQIIHQPQPVNVQVKLQPKYISPPERQAAVKREVKSELDETLKKLKKLAEEKK